MAALRGSQRRQVFEFNSRHHARITAPVAPLQPTRILIPSAKG